MRFLLAYVAFAVLSGCTVMHPSSLAGRMGCDQTCQSDVCVIMVEATPDLGRWAKLPEITDYFRCHGIDTVYFNPYFDGLQADALADCIRYHRRCRGKRIMLVAWSYATVQSLNAMDILAEEGIDIETFIDIECLGLNVHKGFNLQPVNAHRTVVVRRNLSMIPIGYDNPTIVRVNTPRHLQALAAPEAMDTYFREYYRLVPTSCPCPFPGPVDETFTAPPTEPATAVPSATAAPPAPVSPAAPAPQ